MYIQFAAINCEIYKNYKSCINSDIDYNMTWKWRIRFLENRLLRLFFHRNHTLINAV